MYWFCSPTMKLPRQLGKKLWLVEGVFTKWSPLTPDLDPLYRYNDTKAPVLNLCATATCVSIPTSVRT